MSKQEYGPSWGSICRIELEEGKYTVLHKEDHGGVTVLRHGEPWRNETGDGFILAMVHRILELESGYESYLQKLNDLYKDTYQRDAVGYVDGYLDGLDRAISVIESSESRET